MNWKTKGWFFRHPRTRLKLPEQLATGSFRSLLKSRFAGRLCWFGMWASVMILTISAGYRDVILPMGQPSPLTLVTSLEVVLPAGSAFRGAILKEDIRIPEGALLIERGEITTPAALAAVQAYRRQATAGQHLAVRLSKNAGDGVILLLGLLLCGAMLHMLKPDIADRNSMLLLFLVISLFTIVPARWFYLAERIPLPMPILAFDSLLPLALSPLLAAILMGPLPALVMGVWVSLAVAILSGYSLAVFTVGVVGAVAVARMTRFVRTRSAVLRLGFCAGLAGAICGIGFSAVAFQAWDIMLMRFVFMVLAGIISSLIALILLPFFEIIFKVSTDISLLELSDFEHPLLKRLAIEAPGTYHHSLMVANLAQAAMVAIGGNALRVGICSYFHDIGKLVKPKFFSENTQFSDSPHDDLTPNMSTLVIISHVKEGVNLALRHKIPRPIIDAIQQHHGTGLVYFFYHKAREGTQMELDLRGRGGALDIKEEDFRYAGPKPQSRETAVICLADSIEASSRSLEKVSPSHIEHLVDDIVDAKLRDGQLDECPLTLAEISHIKKAFVFALTNMLHSRISYPNNENRNKQQAVAGSSKSEADEENRPAFNGKG